MSEVLSAFHAQTSIIFEKLYESKNEPNELNDVFIQEYFKLVNNLVKLDAEEDEVGPVVPLLTEVKLSEPDRGLIDVTVEKDKFVVCNLQAVKILHGFSMISGQLNGMGEYLLTNVRRFIIITIKTLSAVVSFIACSQGSPFAVAETEEGLWEEAGPRLSLNDGFIAESC